MKRIGVVLSGCGVQDGSEIHEAVLTLLAIDRHGAEAVCLAPDAQQSRTVDHLSGQEMPEKRNILVESARIARGRIRDVAVVDVSELDALIFPGGFGAALNLCDFARKGAACTVHPDVARLVRGARAAGKPVGAICIAPALLARILGEDGVPARLTIGTDPDTASRLEAMGVRHEDCPASGCVVDREHRIVTTPAYMLAGHISEVAEGIDRAVSALLEMA